MRSDFSFKDRREVCTPLEGGALRSFPSLAIKVPIGTQFWHEQVFQQLREAFSVDSSRELSFVCEKFNSITGCEKNMMW